MDDLGRVYVADWGNHRIQVFDEDGVFLWSWGCYGSDDAQFIHPKGLASDGLGNVYVVDCDNHRIQKFAPATGNSPPAAPVVEIQPRQPTTNQHLDCRVIGGATDPNGDQVTFTYTWYKDGVLVPNYAGDRIRQEYTAPGEVWRCVVTPNDGKADGPTAEATVTIQ